MPHRISPTPKQQLPLRLAPVYCPPTSLPFRFLGFLLILRAFAALVLINLLCLPFSSTSYCDSSSLVLRKTFLPTSAEYSSGVGAALLFH
ncbi:hypothetical protein F5146DRAFT_1051140 [Armillaria mellea]|nr:hypothetical protein F5146DRAFT_1051140 [Armillaria mellea]